MQSQIAQDKLKRALNKENCLSTESIALKLGLDYVKESENCILMLSIQMLLLKAFVDGCRQQMKESK